MCQKGGPRCASHLKQEIRKIQKETSNSNKADHLLFEYYGTKSGQKELESTIDKTQDIKKKEQLLELKDKAKIAREKALAKKTPQQSVTKIYRAGSLEPPREHDTELTGIITTIDSFKPENRQGRFGGIFASPDMASHARWLKGTALANRFNPHDTYEIEVDPDNTYIYNVDSYEEVSDFIIMNKDKNTLEIKSKIKEKSENFWNSGMTLTEFKEWSKTAKPKDGDWEIIISPESIQNYNQMTNKKIIESVPSHTQKEINALLEPKRAYHGLVWRKNILDKEELIDIKNKINQKYDQQLVSDVEKIYVSSPCTEEEITDFKKPFNNYLNKIKRIREKRGESTEINDEQKQKIKNTIIDFVHEADNKISNKNSTQ